MRAWRSSPRNAIALVASYTVLAATGALSAQVLALKIEVYDPRDPLPAGARRLGRRGATPDGR